MASKISFFVLLLALAGSSLAASPQCIDESGKPVDWYIVYKFPYLAHLAQPLFGGYRYAVISSALNDGWHLSPHNTTDSTSIFAQTLAPVYATNAATKVDSVFYNDQPPGTTDAPAHYAHAKGVLVGDDQAGFWLIHTVPHFAPSEGTYSYIASGGRYGQVALCISLSAAELEKVVAHNFLTAQPFAYSTNIAHTTSGLGVAVAKLAKSQWIASTSYAESNLTSVGGVHFRSFYKSPDDHVDLYAGIVAPALATNLMVETWRRNPGTPLESECTNLKTKVENVHQVKVGPFVNAQDSGAFDYTEDHSKWALSGETASTVCLGDMNRMESQFKRGGGTTCITNAAVWKAFNSFVGSIEKCGA